MSDLGWRHLTRSDKEAILRGIEGISFVYLEAADVVRHRLVKDIIDAYAAADVERERGRDEKPGNGRQA